MRKRATKIAFLHGGAQGGWVWDETIEALKKQADGISAKAFDLPGCGTKRSQNVSTFSGDDIAQAFIDDLRQWTQEPVLLVGHSNAGTIMPIVAARCPELIHRLVYVSCLAPEPGRTIVDLFGSVPHGQSENHIGWPGDPSEDTGTRLPKMFCNDMTEAEAQAFMAKLGRDAWPTHDFLHTDTAWRYDHLSAVPATFVLCLRDAALPPAWQEIFAKRFQVDRIVRLDAGHQAMNTRPYGLAEIILNEMP